MSGTRKTYTCSKTYSPERGLSCCFRQWRSTHSHCQYLHGYALGVRITFEAVTLDERNWVVDYGSMKPIKEWLERTFDHKTVVAVDDPCAAQFSAMEDAGICQITWVDATGTEKFAEYIFQRALEWLLDERAKGRCSNVTLKTVEVWEHDGNRASFGYEPRY